MMNPSTIRSRPLSAIPTIAAVAASIMLWGCAPMPPLPFDLVDKSNVYHGILLQSERRVEADVGGKHFQGYYLQVSGTATMQSGGWRRFYPYDLRERNYFVSNAARASMAAPDGERLSCEFIVEDTSAIGECVSTSGKTYHLVTQVR